MSCSQAITSFGETYLSLLWAVPRQMNLLIYTQFQGILKEVSFCVPPAQSTAAPSNLTLTKNREEEEEFVEYVVREHLIRARTRIEGRIKKCLEEVLVNSYIHVDNTYTRIVFFRNDPIHFEFHDDCLCSYILVLCKRLSIHTYSE
jgi:hypothetical protein